MKAAKASEIAILGGGNLGRALALGWAQAGRYPAERVHVTRRDGAGLADLAARGFRTGSSNLGAVEAAEIVVIAVQPQQLAELAVDVRGSLDPDRHRLISVASGVTISELREIFGQLPIVRAMPNTGIAIGESMTCLAAEREDATALTEAIDLFDAVGRTLVIRESMMTGATALCACGVAFFLRAVRAASQGGIEIGFHPDEALLLAAQTARGSASLLLAEERHPEAEIDRVTTPRGCTIAGLNEMEHQGFSSALIKGILLSAEKAARLYDPDRPAPA